SKHGQATIGTIVCGSSPCQLKVLSAVLEVKTKGGKTSGKGSKGPHGRVELKGAGKFKISAAVPVSLGAGKSAPVKVTVKGPALAELVKVGTGKVAVQIRVSEALGKKTETFKSTVDPAKKSKPGKKKGGR